MHGDLFPTNNSVGVHQTQTNHIQLGVVPRALGDPPPHHDLAKASVYDHDSDKGLKCQARLQLRIVKRSCNACSPVLHSDLSVGCKRNTWSLHDP